VRGELRSVWARSCVNGLWAGALLLATGCASLSDKSASGPPPEDQVEALLGSLHSADTAPGQTPATPAAIEQAQASAPATVAEAEQPKLPIPPVDPAAKPPRIEDPFGGPIPEDEEEYDPWEPVNVKTFEFNRKLDKYVLKPIATGYNKIMPDLAQRGVQNFFINARWVPRFFNNLFQGKIKGAGIEAGRFLINSTVGVAGFVDVAKRVGLETPREDFGQTLGFYGVKPGPYLIIPFLPPYTVRDFSGFVFDFFLDPLNFFVFPIIEFDGAPRVFRDRDVATLGQVGTRIFEIINERSLNLEKFQGVEEATLDLYGAVRNAYLQSRAKAIKQ
jgi:phospholipid-binding lipoprotein MlaA